MPLLRPINVTQEVYDSVKQASEKNGYETVSKFVSDLLGDYGFQTDDVKTLIRIPADVAADQGHAKEFLNGRVEMIMKQLFP